MFCRLSELDMIGRKLIFLVRIIVGVRIIGLFGFEGIGVIGLEFMMV